MKATISLGWGWTSDPRRNFIQFVRMHGETNGRWEVWVSETLVAECSNKWMAQMILKEAER